MSYKTSLFSILLMFSVNSNATETISALQDPDVTRKIHGIYLEEAEACFNDFYIKFRIESSRMQDGTLQPQTETVEGQTVYKFHPLADRAIKEFEKLNTEPLAESDISVGGAYWRKDGQEVLVGFELAVKFKLELPSDLPNQVNPLHPDNRSHAQFADQLKIMSDLYLWEARSGRSEFLVHETWGIPVRINCQRNLGGIRGSNN